ncbi:MAG: tRNA lysidine(34) synthetase TilS [Gemmatimonadota bacterium]|nr:tRNA lysidine(34) synthetase TilS [Gemmatimonadota bacterium]
MSDGSHYDEGAQSVVLAAVQNFLDQAGERPQLVVAFSGGLDSCVLLHALRALCLTDPSKAPILTAAHFDHSMRDGSSEDADWVVEMCDKWAVPITVERAEKALESEADARAARYAFLDRTRIAAGHKASVLTAHHADDQAETVLFRMLRGTGPDGLRGIAGQRKGIARPLLGLWREDLEAYARIEGLGWREDPTNQHLGYARNALRHKILPELELLVAPGAKKALARLARISGVEAEAWSEALTMLFEMLDGRRDEVQNQSQGPSLDVDGDALRALGQPLRTRVIRYLASEVGVILSEAGAERVSHFLYSSSSGRTIELGGRATASLQLDRVVFLGNGPSLEPARSPLDETVVIESGSQGDGELRLAGKSYRVVWAEEPSSDSEKEDEAFFELAGLLFPLEVRARAPGDRLRNRAGSRKVKKLMLEQRIPIRQREVMPVLVDARGDVLWVPGVARSTSAETKVGTPSLRVRILP